MDWNAPITAERLRRWSRCCLQAERPVQASRLALAAVALEPAAGRAFELLGLSRGFTSGREIPLALHRKAAALDARCSASLNILAKLAISQKGVDETDRALVAAALRQVDDADLDPVGLAHRWFAYGNAELAWGDKARALKAFLQAKKLTIQRLGAGFDPAESRIRSARIMEAFTAETIRRNSSGLAAERPVFIVGMPNCGASTVQGLVRRRSGWPTFGEHKGLHAVSEIAEWRLDPDDGTLALANRSEARFRKLRTAYFPESEEPPTRWVDKQLGNYEQLGLAAILFPSLKIVDVVRDPADNCLSCLRSFFDDPITAQYTATPADFRQMYRQYRTFMDHWRRVLPETAIFTLRFERMLSDETRQATLTDLCRFLGISPAPSSEAWDFSADPIGFASQIPDLVRYFADRVP